MKKSIICLFTVFVIIIAVVFNWYWAKLQEQKEIKSYNLELEQYTKENITGVSVTTIINKAIDENEQYSISKDENGFYKNDGKYSLEILVKLEEEGKLYPMEALEKVGVEGFTKAYGTAVFKAKNLEYHKNGRISKIVFEIQNTK